MALNLMRRAVQVLNRITNVNAGRVQAFSLGNVGGVWLSHDEALRLSAVWACVCVISKALASSCWDVFTEQADGNRSKQTSSKIHQIFNTRPNREMTPIAFKDTIMAIALLWGNAYAEIERDTANRPVALWPLDPTRCFLVRGYFDADGNFVYSMTGELALRVRNWDKPDTFLPYNDVYHIHGLGLDGFCGLDLVGLAARSFLQNLATERFSLKFYEHGTSLGGVLTTEKDLDQGKLDKLKAGIKDRVSGVENAFEFLVLSGGFKWQNLTTSLSDIQHTDTRYFLIEETCRWFGVPPHKIAHLLRATFSNIEHLGIEFQRDALRPWAVRCEQEADYKLLPVGPFIIKIDLEWAAEGDSKTKAETAGILADHGFINRNEWRRERGMNTIGAEGDIFTVQANMTTLKRLAAGPVAPIANSSQDPAKENPEEQKQDPNATSTAKALLLSAMRRSLNRQMHRAQEASRGISSARRQSKIASQLILRFEEKMRSGEGAHMQYVQNQISEMLRVCANVGIELACTPTSFSAELKKYFAEESHLLLEAYKTGDVTKWCDIEQRAQSVTENLMRFVN